MTGRNPIDAARELTGRLALALAGLWLGAVLVSRGDPVRSTGKLAAWSDCPGFTPAAAAQLTDNPVGAQPSSPDPDRLMDHVRRLAEDIGARPAGSPQELQAAQYVAGYLKGLGYSVGEMRDIALGLSGRTTRNVVALAPGSAAGKPGVLIGAHYDSFALDERSPGANDNASGVAVMLETARLCAGNTGDCPLYFVGFGGEERQADGPGHCLYGSRYFHAHQPRPLAAMISVDMVGVGDRLCLGYQQPAPQPLVAMLEQAAARAGVAVVRDPQAGVSDHKPFAQGEVPAVWLQRRPDTAQHTEQDTAERIEPVHLQSAVTLLVQFIEELTAADLDALAGWAHGPADPTGTG